MYKRLNLEGLNRMWRPKETSTSCLKIGIFWGKLAINGKHLLASIITIYSSEFNKFLTSLTENVIKSKNFSINVGC